MSGALGIASAQSDCNGSLDVRMSLVVAQVKILMAEVEQVADRRIEMHGRQSKGRACKLQIGLFEVIQVKVRITKGMHEDPQFQVADLGNHHGQQGIGGYVEGHAQEDVGAALVELAVKRAIG